jgi:replicative superfamily II helicase
MMDFTCSLTNAKFNVMGHFMKILHLMNVVHVITIDRNEETKLNLTACHVLKEIFTCKMLVMKHAPTDITEIYHLGLAKFEMKHAQNVTGHQELNAQNEMQHLRILSEEQPATKLLALEDTI